MRIYDPNELLGRNFNLHFMNALLQRWHSTKFFRCIGKPKRQSLLLYLNGCDITYTDADGNTFRAHSGDTVYTPIGSEYRASISGFRDKNAHTVGINFHLFDEDGEPIALSEGIRIFPHSQGSVLPLLFRRALNYDTAPSMARNRILLMEILCSLASQSFASRYPERILPALEYLAEHIEENPTVAKLAELCGVSQVYFRKQFKSSLGMTPLEYRNSLRLGRAASYLEYGEISVQEISDALGYSTASHFIQEFGKRYGCPPLKYRRCLRGGAGFGTDTDDD